MPKALTRDLIAGAGLTGGGTLEADRTFNIVGSVAVLLLMQMT